MAASITARPRRKPAHARLAPDPRHRPRGETSSPSSPNKPKPPPSTGTAATNPPRVSAATPSNKRCSKQRHRSRHLQQRAARRAPRNPAIKAASPIASTRRTCAACFAISIPPKPLPAPAKLRAPKSWPKSLALDDLRLMPTSSGTPRWQPRGSQAKPAHRKRFKRFLEHTLAGLQPSARAPRRCAAHRGLSPHLHFGEIGPRQIWHALGAKGRSSTVPARNHLARVRAITCSITSRTPRRNRCARSSRDFPWKTNAKFLRAWQRGRTGVPMVDAGMRELWATGVMHNRVRMIVGSFLVKNLLQPWQEGARWFWDTLVDADLASNTTQLAVGRRLGRGRRAVLPHLQSRDTGRALRSGRRLRAQVGAGARRASREAIHAPGAECHRRSARVARGGARRVHRNAPSAAKTDRQLRGSSWLPRLHLLGITQSAP